MSNSLLSASGFIDIVRTKGKSEVSGALDFVQVYLQNLIMSDGEFVKSEGTVRRVSGWSYQRAFHGDRILLLFIDKCPFKTFPVLNNEDGL